MSRRKTKRPAPGPSQALLAKAAPSIAERWPDIAEIEVERSFYPSDGDCTKPIQGISARKVATPEHKAHIWFPCPDRECVEGGHDITDTIDAMRRSQQTTGEFKNICQGWQDPERYMQYHCLCRVEGTITIRYR